VPRREVDSRLAAACALFPVLRERSSQRAGTLSGGEQQMLAIGRALMARPRLLLLDEPSLGLAPLLVREIFRVIERINREGVTVLLVEQNARRALALATRGYVLETGRVAVEGSSAALAADPRIRAAYLGMAGPPAGSS
jgi:branched-chain amino acid transport system ATP-binding protein